MSAVADVLPLDPAPRAAEPIAEEVLRAALAAAAASRRPALAVLAE